MKSKLAKTVAVEVQISTAFVVLAIPATTLPAPEYLEELAGATASATTGVTSVTTPASVLYVPVILVILIHFMPPLMLQAPRADEFTALYRSSYSNLILVMHSKVTLSAAMFMVEPLRMVCFNETLSAANSIAVPKAVDAEASDAVFKVETRAMVGCAKKETAEFSISSGIQS